ncbi:RIP metalloprotease RseP [Roseobacter sp. HKCCD5988]|uniref:RIP metalloprotease RseP n=1 Tax=Roseobacter sp. HKCCD5988 TaxID=3120338 RepID=UPI0030EB59D2
MDFLPQFGSFAFTMLAFIAAISIIVAIHEYGHYIVGRWSGIRADVFSIGFGPVLLSRKDRRGTQWQIAALPFGGYVKFAGDANAASVGADAAVTPARNTMHGAPLWARAATVVAGPLFNFILSIAIFAGVVLVSGQATEEPLVGAPRDLPPAYQSLEAGDLILALEGQEIESFAALLQIASDLPPSPRVSYEVLRDDRATLVEASAPLPPVVDGVQPQSAAMEAGLSEGDVILAVNGADIWNFSQLRAAVDQAEGAPIDLTLWRANGTQVGQEIAVTLSPRRTDLPVASGGFETRYLIGVTGGMLFVPQTEAVGPLAALSYGVSQTGFIITSSLSGLWHMITGVISTCNLQGPVGIAETSGAAAAQGIASFIWLIAVLSTAVGLMNLFPIPILDGGHLMLYAFEAVAGCKPPEMFMRVFMTVGLTLIMGLMVFAVLNDVLLCP